MLIVSSNNNSRSMTTGKRQRAAISLKSLNRMFLLMLLRKNSVEKRLFTIFAPLAWRKDRRVSFPRHIQMARHTNVRYAIGELILMLVL